MNKMHKQLICRSSLFLLILLSALNVGSAVEDAEARTQNPFTPKAFVIRYWDRKISNNLPKPSFLLSKSSPLSAADAATFADLAAANTLSTKLPEFCSAANLLCFTDVLPSLSHVPKDGPFEHYDDGQNFTNYGTGGLGSLNSFKNYSNTFFSVPQNDFRRYSRNSGGNNDSFTTYGFETNLVDEIFNTYGTNSDGGSGEFKEYARESNVPDLRFSTYSDSTAGREQTFTHYSEDGNAGEQSFTSYGKNSAGPVNNFTSYGTNSNVVGSDFSNYAEGGAGPNDTFTNYGVNMNNPTENFKSYARESVSATEKFANYRDQANVGADNFQSYAEGTDGGTRVEFDNYGKSFNEGTDTFKGYAKNAASNSEHKIDFKGYGVNNTFKEYSKDGITFTGYTNASSSSGEQSVSGSMVNKWVEPGKFFRERMLKLGTVMPMPDVTDKMPKRSFLPRSILTKLPFQSSELKRVFRVSNDSSMDKMITDSLGDCERAPSVGETKRCVGSVEDMIDFATSVLGRDVTVRTTENVNGSKKNVMVGQVKGVNGGKVTQSVSCHQSLFPYLLYYCHSVPKVRVYEADLLDPDTKEKINNGVALCHLDTSAWSSTHGAFMALGSGPGQIEVCHWIFENDMTWTIADSVR